MRLFVAILAVGIMTFALGDSDAHADKVDILIEKLVEKGILSHSEAKEFVGDIQEEEERRQEEIKQTAVEAAKSEAQSILSSIPKWVEKMNFHGDLRLRHDTQWRDTGDDDYDRNRERFRLRFGFDVKPTETTKVGVRLASGSGYQNTTNQSFDEHSRGKDIFIDRAYASWKATDFLKITGGKHKNPLFKSSLVWDSDVNPEGLSESFKFDITDRTCFFLNFGQWFIEEFSTTSDPTLFVYQIGSKIKASDKVKVTVAATYYDFMNLDEYRWGAGVLNDKEKFLGYNNKHGQQMIFDSRGKLINEFGCLEFAAKVKIKDVLPVPLSLFGTCISNSDADIDDLIDDGVDPGDSDPLDLMAYGGDDRDTGWQVGLSLGNKKKKGDWYLKYFYQVLEDYAFPAVFVDSDFHGGGTNNQGHCIQGRYLFTDNIQARATAFLTERDDESKDGQKDEDRIQLDMIFAF